MLNNGVGQKEVQGWLTNPHKPMIMESSKLWAWQNGRYQRDWKLRIFIFPPASSESRQRSFLPTEDKRCCSLLERKKRNPLQF